MEAPEKLYYELGLKTGNKNCKFREENFLKQIAEKDTRIAELEVALNLVSTNNNSGKPNKFIINNIINNALEVPPMTKTQITIDSIKAKLRDQDALILIAKNALNKASKRNQPMTKIKITSIDPLMGAEVNPYPKIIAAYEGDDFKEDENHLYIDFLHTHPPLPVVTDTPFEGNVGDVVEGELVWQFYNSFSEWVTYLYSDHNLITQPTRQAYQLTQPKKDLRKEVQNPGDYQDKSERERRWREDNEDMESSFNAGVSHTLKNHISREAVEKLITEEIFHYKQEIEMCILSKIGEKNNQVRISLLTNLLDKIKVL